MKRLVRLSALFLAIACLARADISPAKAAEINKTVEIFGLRQTILQLKERMITDIDPATVPPGYAAKFREKFSVDDMVNQLIPLYDKYFSLEDLKAINAFYSSEVGQRMIKTMPLLTQESGTIGIKLGNQVAIATMQELQKEQAVPQTKGP